MTDPITRAPAGLLRVVGNFGQACVDIADDGGEAALIACAIAFAELTAVERREAKAWLTAFLDSPAPASDFRRLWRRGGAELFVRKNAWRPLFAAMRDAL